MKLQWSKKGSRCFINSVYRLFFLELRPMRTDLGIDSQKLWSKICDFFKERNNFSRRKKPFSLKKKIIFHITVFIVSVKGSENFSINFRFLAKIGLITNQKWIHNVKKKVELIKTVCLWKFVHFFCLKCVKIIVIKKNPVLIELI